MPWFVALAVLTAASTARRSSEEIQTTTAWLKDAYHAELVLAGIHYPLQRFGYVVGGQDPSPAAAAAYLPMLRRELAKYPPSLLERTRTRKIILTRKLSLNGQPRAAVPDFDTMNLFLDVELGRAFPVYQARVFHHEFFHLLDVLQSGRWLRDTEWPQLNPPSFRYGTGGVRMQDPRSNPFAPLRTIPGFVSLYGTAAVEEDKAELFSFLLTDGAFVHERAACDLVVHVKLDRLRLRLERLCPEMNACYYQRLSLYQAGAAAVPATWLLFVLGGGNVPPCLAIPAPGVMGLTPTSADNPSPASRECPHPSR